MKLFSLHIRLLSTEIPFEGPIPLYIEVIYNGDDKVKVQDDDPMDIHFRPPKGWKMREMPILRKLDGRLQVIMLIKGQSLSRIIYLHDYFSCIKQGRIELPVTVEIWLKNGLTDERIMLKDTCTFEVLEPNPNLFVDRINKIRSQIASEKVADKRLELYKSVASLSHPDLVPLFFDSLLNNKMLTFHSIARSRLVELAEAYERRGLIIDYLVNHGGRYDADFFSLWKKRQVSLSEEEIKRLSKTSNLWVKLLCLEHYRKQYNRKGLVESLKSELEELTERAKKLGDNAT